jgi:serine/threonine protein kinase
MERRVSCFPDGGSGAFDIEKFSDCPFLSSPYLPVKDESRNLVVRTYFAIHKETGDQVVIKLLERGKTCSPAVLQELHVHWMSYGHPYIAELKDVFLTEQYLAIVMAFAPGFDLDALIKQRGRPLTEEVARNVFQQLLLAVKFLHNSGFVNRDLRTNNIIFDEETGSMKLQDFMYSRHDQINSDPREAFKRLPYTSPELLSGGSKVSFGESSNVWELGVCLFKMVTGKFPFERDSDGPISYKTVPIVISRISKMEYSIPDHLSDHLRDLLNRIFVLDTKSRIQLDEILLHPWIDHEWPTSPDKISEAMRTSACPVSKDALDMIIEGAKRTSAGRAYTKSMEDELIDVAAVDEMMEDQTLNAMKGTNI